MNVHRILLLVLVSSFVFVSAVRAEDDDLTGLDLLTLMSMDVTVISAAKRAQSSRDAAAAVHVITREDIRRSGATSIPELLRGVPGLQVARINTRSWAVTARGFNSRFANKLLVMVDGRSIYTPTFSGVMWEEQPVLLENIERIEVVRGPGGALWGINAVNGIINIITRRAADTHGLQLSANAGSEESAASLRYGQEAAIGDLRFYLEHGRIDALDGYPSDIERTQGGWRLDRAALGGQLTLQGDMHRSDFSAYDGLADSALPRYADVGNVLANWQRPVDLGHLELRTFYNWVERSTPGEWDESTLGADAHLSVARRGRHLLTAGAGFRRVYDRQIGTPHTLGFAAKGANHQWSLYAQDELYFLGDAVRLTVGAKLEDFEYTGLAVQPTLRGLWRINDEHTLWAAASRAVRTPSRFELHSRISVLVAAMPPTFIELRGDESLEDEELTAFEAGWRWRPLESLSLDLAAYRNRYRDLISLAPLPMSIVPGLPPRVVLPYEYRNAQDARTYGAELSAQWRARQWLQLEASGSWFDLEYSNDSVGLGINLDGRSVDPEQSLNLRARIDLSRHVDLDVAWRAVDALEGLGVGAYDALDARLAWRPVPGLELSLRIENVLDEEHVEFTDEISGMSGAKLGRMYFGRILWQPRR